MFDSYRTDIALTVQVENCIFVEVPCLSYVQRSELYIESIGILKISNLHGLNALSKNALCTVSPSESSITIKYFPFISGIWTQRRIRPSSCTVSRSGVYTPLSIHSL